MNVEYTVDEAGQTPVPRKFAARVLELSPQTLTKGLHAGVIPATTVGSLGALTAVPVLSSVATDDGVPVPILRTAPKGVSTWDAYDPPRQFTGYSTDMSDAEVTAACDRWWTRSGVESVLEAGAMIIAVGGWTVSLLAVDGIAQELSGGGNCVHYDARLVARRDSPLHEHARLIDTADPLAADADELLGKRVPGGSGGVITRLPVPELN